MSTATLFGLEPHDELFRKTLPSRVSAPPKTLRSRAVAVYKMGMKVSYAKRRATQERTALPSPLPASVEPLRNILQRSLTFSITSTPFSPTSADLLRSTVAC